VSILEVVNGAWEDPRSKCRDRRRSDGFRRDGRGRGAEHRDTGVEMIRELLAECERLSPREREAFPKPGWGIVAFGALFPCIPSHVRYNGSMVPYGIVIRSVEESTV